MREKADRRKYEKLVKEVAHFKTSEEIE